MSGMGAGRGWKPVLVAVVVALVVGGASFVVARTVSGDDDTSSAPAEAAAGGHVAEVPTEEVVVLAPVPGVSGADAVDPGGEGAGPDAATPVAPDDGLALSAGVGRVAVPTVAAARAGIPPLLAAPGSDTPTTPPEDTDAGAEERPPGGPTPSDLDPDTVLGPAGRAGGGTGFVDPCAGAAPGADPSAEGCPGDAEGGTITGYFALEAPPPLWVVGHPWPNPEAPGEGSVTQCPPMEVPAGEVPFGIAVSNPATLTLRWWSDRDPTVRSQELRTTDAQRRAWEQWRDDGQPPRTAFQTPRVCTTLDGVQVGDTISIDLVAVDEAGQIASASDSMLQSEFLWRPPRDPATVRVRPPTRLWAVGPNELAVIAPVQEGQEVQVIAYPRVAMSDTDPCVARSLTDHPGYDMPQYGWLRNVTEIPVERRSEPSYPYEFAWVANHWGGVRLPAGANVRLCIVRHRVEGATFERGAEDVEAFEVSVPDRRPFELVLRDVSSREPIAPGALRIEARPPARGVFSRSWCFGGYRGDPLDRGTTTVDQVLCATRPDMLDGFDRGVVVDIEFLDPDGGDEPLTSTFVLPLSLRCAGPCTDLEPERYRIELPTVSRAAGLCSPGLFESSCEPPRADVVLGAATLEVVYGRGGGNNAGDWWVGPAELLGDQRIEAAGAQLDLASPGAQGGTVEEPTWVQQLHLDRPATVRARLIPIVIPGEELDVCTLPGAVTEVRSDIAATDHTVTFTGLCPGSPYAIEATLTDEDGDVTVWAPPLTAGANSWHGAFFVTESIRLSVTSTIELGPLPGPGDGGYVHTASAWAGGTQIRWVNEMTGCHPDWRRINGNPTTAFAGRTVELRVVVEASGVRGQYGCFFEGTDGTPLWGGGRVVLRAEIPWQEAVAADEIVLSSGPDDPVPVSVTYRFTRRR